MKWIKTNIKIIGTVFLLFHFGLTILYTLPGKPLGPFKALANFYMRPFFDQGWSLFAPVPKYNYLLAVKTEQKQSWSFPFEERIEMFRTNPLSPQGKLVLLYSNSLGLLSAQWDKNTKFQSFPLNSGAGVAIRKLLGPIYNVSGQAVEILVIETEPINQSVHRVIRYN